MTKFYLDIRKGPDEKKVEKTDWAIRVSTSAGGKRLLTTIGYSISPEFWDAQTCRVKPGTKKNPVMNSKGVTAAEINERILAVETEFTKLDKNPAATADMYKAALDNITGNSLKKARKSSAKNDIPYSPLEAFQSPTTSEVLSRFDEFVREERGACLWSDGTVKCWNAFRIHLLTFKRELSFEDFDEAGLKDFIIYLRTRAMSDTKIYKAHEKKAQAEAILACDHSLPKERKLAESAIRQANGIIARTIEDEGLEEKTVKKHYSNLKWFLNWCIRKDYCKPGDVNKFRPKIKLVEKGMVTFSPEEMLRIYRYEIPKNGTVVKLHDHSGRPYEKTVEDAGALEKTRDLFCFCYHTALRYSDMAALKRSAVKSDRIVVTTIKTSDRREIKLTEISKAILRKYAGQSFPNDMALPVISNQKMNYYLKDLCELCGFNEPMVRTYFKSGRRVDEVVPKWSLVGAHTGRRSHITNRLKRGESPYSIMQTTGHKDFASFKAYINHAAVEDEDWTKAF